MSNQLKKPSCRYGSAESFSYFSHRSVTSSSCALVKLLVNFDVGSSPAGDSRLVIVDHPTRSSCTLVVFAVINQPERARYPVLPTIETQRSVDDFAHLAFNAAERFAPQ
eukprot:scaffold117936_cov63-Phaeocystis_antarctica.AAC.3